MARILGVTTAVSGTMLDLGQLRRLYVWRDECPVPAEVAGTLQASLAISTPTTTQSGRVTLEAILPKGGMVMYGLLGGEYRAAAGKTGLTIDVGYTDAAVGGGPPFASELIVRPDRAVAGLPHAFADTVLAVLQEAVRAGPNIGPGRLKIDCAAHAAIGSNDYIFRALARVLVQLLVRRPTEDNDLVALAAAELR